MSNKTIDEAYIDLSQKVADALLRSTEGQVRSAEKTAEALTLIAKSTEAIEKSTQSQREAQIAHHTECTNSFKELRSLYYKIILGLIAALSVLTGIKILWPK